MFDPRIELLLQHHPLSVMYRRRLPLKSSTLTEHDEGARTILDIFGLAFAAFSLVGLFALVAAHEASPPPVSLIAEVPPAER